MLTVNSINCGIVIDHIAAGNGIKIFEKLKLDEVDFPVVLLINVPSRKLGRKDIIKIENKIDVDLTMLGLIDPNITVNIIENDKIVKKMNTIIPEEVQGLFKCKNPRCVSNFDEYVTPKFHLAKANGKIHYRCGYCEELTTYSI
ncbi:MAG TPA: aspartate carbamoyltransferase regulatory subunit [Bacillota bacterium]|nr:aspartate carbamoyltransferase regulatory subunit [Clostridiaceae bacterium]HNR05266.1 aspartate carbamoyltransferase regulatory subunit [Bacillota bacterium]HNT04085.1 aspartate carbamoyltransferase regulatory subunit [Bacillota bacterium]HPA54668.1 aspartate carbamoyltransferase regulatory subunit [Bacillota bacterium]HPX69282.1 aspartate carbamoyltransferase regulatory subunit [Bacillota bacterium]